MAQSRARFSYERAHELRERLIEAYAGAEGFGAHRAERTFTVVNHTVWKNDEPNEYSSLELHERGESGITPVTIKALAEVGFGLEQPYDNKESSGGVMVNKYNLSSYHDPAWDWANPRVSGVDPTRPEDERDERVKEWLEANESNSVPPRREREDQRATTN